MLLKEHVLISFPQQSTRSQGYHQSHIHAVLPRSHSQQTSIFFSSNNNAQDNQLKVLNIFQSLIFPPQRKSSSSLYNSNIKCTPSFFSLCLWSNYSIQLSVLKTTALATGLADKDSIQKNLSDDSDVLPSITSYCLSPSTHHLLFYIKQTTISGYSEKHRPLILLINQGQRREDGYHLEMRFENQ